MGRSCLQMFACIPDAQRAAFGSTHRGFITLANYFPQVSEYNNS